MRILFMGHAFPPLHAAGGELMVLSMLRPLVQRGHDVHVLLSRDWQPDDYVLDGIHVWAYRDKNDPWGHIEKADVVLSHLENTPRAVILCRMLNRPHVYIVHNDRPASRTWVGEGSALTVFNSQWMADELGPTPGQIVVRPPVTAEHYRTTPGERVTLINLWDEKGGDLLVDLARRMPDVNFLGVIGAYGKPQVTADLSNLQILGHQRGTYAMRDNVYHQTRILLMPSLYESWGRTAVEAMCSGIPVIAHPTPGLLESCDSAGVFADRDDPDEWVRQIRRLLRPRQWAQASRKALARAAQLDPTEDLDVWVRAVEAL